jgi:hypothetical protein
MGCSHLGRSDQYPLTTSRVRPPGIPSRRKPQSESVWKRGGARRGSKGAPAGRATSAAPGSARVRGPRPPTTACRPASPRAGRRRRSPAIGMDPVGAGPTPVVEAIPAVPARPIRAHLHQPAPDDGGLGREGHGHGRAAPASRDELGAGVRPTHLLLGRAPSQHPGPHRERVARRDGERYRTGARTDGHHGRSLGVGTSGRTPRVSGNPDEEPPRCRGRLRGVDSVRTPRTHGLSTRQAAMASRSVAQPVHPREERRRRRPWLVVAAPLALALALLLLIGATTAAGAPSTPRVLSMSPSLR